MQLVYNRVMVSQRILQHIVTPVIRGVMCSRRKLCTNSAANLDVKTSNRQQQVKLGDWKDFLDFNEKFEEKADWKRELAESMLIYPNFISKEEEDSLMRELEPYISRLHYENSHWDDAIHNYRETERSRWTKANECIINRVRSTAFPPQVSPLKLVHILDLAKDGVIKPHVDSVRFCGDTIAGISLLTSSVMRLRLEEERDIFCDIFLPQFSLYVMKGFARYKFTHEILGEAESIFKGSNISKGRRISIICRNEPPPDGETPTLFTDVKPLPA